MALRFPERRFVFTRAQRLVNRLGNHLGHGAVVRPTRGMFEARTDALPQGGENSRPGGSSGRVLAVAEGDPQPGGSLEFALQFDG